jgi:hypothetical protein
MMMCNPRLLIFWTPSIVWYCIITITQHFGTWLRYRPTSTNDKHIFKYHTVITVQNLLQPSVYDGAFKSLEAFSRWCIGLTRHPSIRKSWYKISPTSGCRSVGIVRSRTKDHGVCFVFCFCIGLRIAAFLSIVWWSKSHKEYNVPEIGSMLNFR